MLLGDRDVKRVAICFLVLFSFGISANDESPEKSFKSSIDSLCEQHPHKEVCEEMVLSLASLAMSSAGFYTQSCMDESKILAKDNNACDKAKSLVGYLRTLKQ